MKRLFFSVVLGLTLITSTALAQEHEKAVAKPKTKLEQFSAGTGAVIVKGFFTMGTLSGLYDSSITIDCKEFANASTGKKVYGITVEVKKKGRFEKSHRSFIDYDEISSLIKGIDYIAGLDKSVTKLSNFEADYRTMGDFTITTFSTDQGIMVAVKSGRIGTVSAYYHLERLAKIKGMIISAKNKIDSIR